MKYLEIPEELNIYFCLLEEIHYGDYMETSIIASCNRINDVLVSWETNLNMNAKNDYTSGEDDYLNNALRYDP